MPVYHVLFLKRGASCIWGLKCLVFKVTEAGENPIYGGISLLHGEAGGWSVLGLYEMLLGFCVCGKVAPYNKQSSGTKDRPR